MTAAAVLKYAVIAAAAVAVLAGALFAADYAMVRHHDNEAQRSQQFARQQMLRLWHYPPEALAPQDTKKLLVLCAYSSPYTRDDIKSAADTYRFLDIWQEAIERAGPEPVEELVRRCRVNPDLVDPTPPQILRRNVIRTGSMYP